MPKVRTRLRRPIEAIETELTTPAKDAWVGSDFSTPPTHGRSFSFSTFIQKRLRHWPALVMAILGWSLTATILSKVSPTLIKDLPWPQSYAPLLLSVWVAVSFSGAFLWLNSRRGFILGTLSVFWLSTRLQQIQITWWWWLTVLFGWVCLETGFSYFRSRVRT